MSGSIVGAMTGDGDRGNDGHDREFALTEVPADAMTPAYKIGIVLLAANISIPTLIMGGELGVKVGFDSTAMACLWAGVILALLAGVCAYAGACSRLTTYVMIMRAFGQRGGEIINLLLSVSAIGWFGVVVVLFAETMGRMLHQGWMVGGAPFWIVSGSVLMALTTIFGFRALNLLSNVLLPLKIGLIAWVLIVAIRTYGLGFTAPISGPIVMDQKTAISFIVGGWVVGAIIAPDFSRFARSPVRAGIACALAVGVGYPFVLLCSSIPAILTGQKDMLATMSAFGMGFAALTIVMLASWTNGSTNLYCASLMLSTVFRRLRRKTLVWISGLIGMILGLAGITDQIIPYLVMLSAVVPPVAGVYLTRFFLDQKFGAATLGDRDWHTGAFVALALGIGAAVAGQFYDHVLTGLVAADSLLVSTITYLAFECLRSGLMRRASAGL